MTNPRGVSMIVPYHRRPRLLSIAWESWAQQARTDGIPLEVVILENDDGESTLPCAPVGATLTHLRIPTPSGPWRSPGLLWNLGARVARHPVVILTHPEIVHFGDVPKVASAHTPERGLLQFSCRTLLEPPADVVDLASFSLWHGDDLESITDHGDINGWYSHPLIRPNLAPWAMAMTPDSFRLVGGFDYRFDAEYGSEDADFAIRVLKTFTERERVLSVTPHVGHLGHGRRHDDKTKAALMRSVALLRRIHGPDADLIGAG